MADTDGKIQLALDVSPEDAIKSFKKLQAQAQKTFNSLSTDKLTKSEEKSLSALNKIVAKGEEAVKKVEQLSNPKESKEYSKLIKEYDTLANKIDEAERKQQQFLDTGGKDTSKTYQNMTANISIMKDMLDDVGREIDQVVASGRQFEVDTTSLNQAKDSLIDVNNQLLIQTRATADLNTLRSEENDALAQQVAKFAEITLNAGEVNPKIASTIDELNEVNAQLDQVRSRMAELEQAGAGLGHEEFDHLLAVENQLVEKQGELNGKLNEYRENMANMQEPMTVWDRVGNLFKQIGHDLLHPIQSMRQLREGTDAAGASAGRAHPMFSKLLSTLGRLATSFITSVSGINRFKSALSGASKKATSAGFSFRKLFTTLVASGIGIRSLYSLFGQIKNAITENLKYFALMNGGMNQTNAAISALQSSLNALKGALAGAFVPILNVVSPILSSLIDQLASVITAIGMFIAKLTGAKSYIKAVKKDTNYAAGLAGGGGSGSNKKSAEERYQEAVEKAQKKYEEQLAKTREKNAKAQAKAEEQQAKAAAKLAKQQEKANKQLGAYDKLNVITTEELEDLEDIQADLYDEPELELPDMEDFLDDIKAAGGAAGEDPFGFEEVPLDDWEFNWDELKAKAEQLGRDLADKLNGFFEDENFAKDLGHNIAEALNTALSFVYGFVDELDWRQMGHWLGTLVQEGLETFDWDLLGRTVGTTLNGIADAIIGFFERYNAGTLGSKLSEALNGAIDVIDPVKLGTALNEVLKDPFIELSSFFTETNWRQLGSKFTTFFHNALTSDALNGQSLGATIGQTLADAVNAGIALLMGADIKQAVFDLTMFFGDMFRKALMGIKWGDLLQTVWSTIIQGLAGFVQGIVTTIYDIIIDAIEAKHPELTGQLEKSRAETHAVLEEAFNEAVATFTGMADTAEQEGDRFTSALATMNDYVVEFPSSFADWGEALAHIQEEYQLTDDAMQTLIDTIITSNDYVDDQSELLKYGEDGWYTYKAAVEETSPALDTATAKQENFNKAVEGVGTTAETTGGKVKDYVKIAADEMATGEQNAANYESNVNSNLQGISDKSKDVELDFSTMTEQINAELEGLTALVDEWYQNLLSQYFSYESWLAMLQQGVLMALNDFMNKDFFNNWDVNMKVWWESKVKPYFSATKWNTEIFGPWKTNKDAKWQELMTWFDQKIEEWWKKVQKYFEQSKWNTEFNNVKTSAETAFQAVENIITSHINTAKQAVLDACQEMREAIAAVKAEMASLGSGGGGFRSSGTSGGWRSATTGGSSSRFSGFMPMLDVMHFEDNLGMSAFKFPELATGAVIPPNNRFLAVLGDQKRGTNIETPLETMVEAFNRALDQRNASNHEPIVLQLNSEVLAEAVWDEEEKRYKQRGDWEPLYG